MTGRISLLLFECGTNTYKPVESQTAGAKPLSTERNLRQLASSLQGKSSETCKFLLSTITLPPTLHCRIERGINCSITSEKEVTNIGSNALVRT